MSDYKNPRPSPSASASDPCVVYDNSVSFDKLINESEVVNTYKGVELQSVPSLLEQIESEANAAIISLGWDPVGEFATGFTYTKLNDVGRDSSGSWWRYNGSDLPKVIAAGTVPSSPNFSLISFETADNVEWKDGQSVGNALDNTFLPKTYIQPPVLGRDSRFQITDSKVALRYGISDALPLDDTQNHYRGLQSSKDAWGDINNLGVGSFAAGRNNAAFAYLSTAYGHDCITYGVASFAAGAGSATGNPDVPGDGATYGYCSFSYGKNTLAKGRVSSSVGELCLSDSDNSGTSGLRAKAGPCVAGMPNPIGAGPVISAGIGAQAHGVDVEAYGDSAAAYGRFIKCYNGAMVFGYGINQGSPIVNAIPGAVGIAANSDIMAIQVTPAPGTNGGFSRIGQNTLYPNQRYESMLKNTDKIAYRLEEGEAGATLSLQRTVGGVISDVVSITFNDAGIGALLINGQQVVSNRAAAIPDAITDANKIQAILDTMRYHGLIAS